METAPVKIRPAGRWSRLDDLQAESQKEKSASARAAAGWGAATLILTALVWARVGAGRPLGAAMAGLALAASAFWFVDAVKRLRAVRSREATDRLRQGLLAGVLDAAAIDNLLRAGASPEPRGGLFGRAALHLAVEGSPGQVEVLLARGLDPNVRDARLQTPLHRAVQIGRIDLAAQLLAAGADPEALDDQGRPPAAFAWVETQEAFARLCSGAEEASILSALEEVRTAPPRRPSSL